MSIFDTKNYVWEHAYKPIHIKDVILPQDYLNFFNKIIRGGASMNLILASSTPGSGKSTTAMALANDLGSEFLFINASDENGIETIRDTVTNFASTGSNNGLPKMIIFDEADGMTPKGQEALRSYIDKYQDSCRFILTCNHIARIIKPLKEEGGRTMVFDYDLKNPKYLAELREKVFKRMTGILTHEKIPYDEKAVNDLIDLKFPSVRSIVTTLQKYAMMKDKIDSDIIPYVQIGDEFKQIVLSKNYTECRKYINEHGLYPVDVFSYLMDAIVPECKNKGDAITQIANYEYQSNMSSDPSIQIAACLVNVFQCI